MSYILRNIFAIMAGWLLGSVINMGLVQLGHLVFPLEGIDPNNMQSLADVLPTLGFQYFIFPFLAHAIGTFIGALLAGSMARSHKRIVCMLIGLLFFVGGVMVNTMLSGPKWFTIMDLVLAYFPMAWLASKLLFRKVSA